MSINQAGTAFFIIPPRTLPRREITFKALGCQA